MVVDIMVVDIMVVDIMDIENWPDCSDWDTVMRPYLSLILAFYTNSKTHARMIATTLILPGLKLDKIFSETQIRPIVFLLFRNGKFLNLHFNFIIFLQSRGKDPKLYQNIMHTGSQSVIYTYLT